MRVVCAWCRKVIKPGAGETSHGICKPCEKKLAAELKDDKVQ